MQRRCKVVSISLAFVLAPAAWAGSPKILRPFDGHVSVTAFASNDQYELTPVALIQSDEAEHALVLLKGTIGDLTAPAELPAEAQLGFPEDVQGIHWVASGDLAIGTQTIDGHVYVLMGSRDAEGQLSATLSEVNGPAIAEFVASKEFVVDDGSASGNSITWLASALLLNSEAASCTPTYDTCLRNAQSTCGERSVASFEYECKKDGSVVCKFTCRSSPPSQQ